MHERKLPEHYRRALRQCIGVGLPCFLAYGMVISENWKYHRQFSQGCLWSAITAALTSMPVIGKVAQVGTERTLGTAVGGLLGYGAHTVAVSCFSAKGGGMFLALLSAVLASAGVVVGFKLGLDLSARLFIITFLLMTFGALDHKDPLKLAITRMGGIMSGVALMVLLTIVILPKSASMEALHNLETALEALIKLNKLAWREHVPEQQQCITPAAGKAGGAGDAGQGQSNGVHGAGYVPLPADGSDAGGASSHEEHERHLEECDTVLTNVYQALFKFQENVDLGKREVLLAKTGGRLVLIPGVPFVGRRSEHMPWGAMAEVASCLRRVARLLLPVIATLEEDFEQDMKAVLGEDYPHHLLEDLAGAMQDVLQALHHDFTLAHTSTPAHMARLTAAVAQLVQVSDTQRRSILQALKGSKKRRFAVESWNRLIAHAQREGGLDRRHSMAAPLPARPVVVPRYGDEARVGSPLHIPRKSLFRFNTFTSRDASPPPNTWYWRRPPQPSQLGGAAQQGAAGIDAQREQQAIAGAPFTAGTPPHPATLPSRPLSLTPPAGNGRGGPPEGLRGTFPPQAGTLPAAASPRGGNAPDVEQGEGGQEGEVRRLAAARLAAMASHLEKDLGGRPGEGELATSWGGAGAGGVLGETRGEKTPVGEPLGAIPSPARGTSPTPERSAGGFVGGGRMGAQERAAQRALHGEEMLPQTQQRWRQRLPAIASGEEVDRIAAGTPFEAVPVAEGERRVDVQSDTLRRAMFPETAEGYVAQVRWYSFQFLMEELVHAMAELHSAVCETLQGLP